MGSAHHDIRLRQCCAPLVQQRPGQAEIGQLDAPVPGHEDIVRLYVAVQHITAVGVVQRLADLHEE